MFQLFPIVNKHNVSEWLFCQFICSDLSQRKMHFFFADTLLHQDKTLSASQESSEWMWLEIELSVCAVPSVQEPIVLTATVFFSFVLVA